MLSIINETSGWIPGKINGKNVKVMYFLNVYINSKVSKIVSIDNRAIVNKDLKADVKIQNVSMYNFIKAKSDEAYDYGVKLFKEGNFTEAILIFSKVLEYNPKDIDALYNRASIRFHLDDKVGACEDWNKIKQLGRSDADEFIAKNCNN